MLVYRKNIYYALCAYCFPHKMILNWGRKKWKNTFLLSIYIYICFTEEVCNKTAMWKFFYMKFTQYIYIVYTYKTIQKIQHSTAPLRTLFFKKINFFSLSERFFSALYFYVAHERITHEKYLYFSRIAANLESHNCYTLVCEQFYNIWKIWKWIRRRKKKLLMRCSKNANWENNIISHTYSHQPRVNYQQRISNHTHMHMYCIHIYIYT